MMDVIQPHHVAGFYWNQSLQCKPLQGYTFYVDVKDDDTEEQMVEKLEGKITSLGGTISKLLNKAILYFISGGGVQAKRPLRRSGRFMKQNETRARSRHVRSRALPCTALDRAKIMGLRIFTLSKVLKWVKEIERRKVFFSPAKIGNKEYLDSLMPVGGKSPSPLPSLISFKEEKETSKHHDEELISPFVKVEDKKRTFEPQYTEFDLFPYLEFRGKAPRNPFREPRRMSASMDLLDKTHDTTLFASLGEEICATECDDAGEKTLSSTSNYSRSGWCDFCESFFRFRDRHIKSKKHQHNIPLENFKVLDRLIRKSSLDDFLRSAMEEKTKREEPNNSRVFRSLGVQKDYCNILRNTRTEFVSKGEKKSNEKCFTRANVIR